MGIREKLMNLIDDPVSEDDIPMVWVQPPNTSHSTDRLVGTALPHPQGGYTFFWGDNSMRLWAKDVVRVSGGLVVMRDDATPERSMACNHRCPKCCKALDKSEGHQ